MKEEVTPNFGLIIAYVIPGAIALVGLGYFVPAVRVWFGVTPENAPTLGGFLFLTIGAIAAGLTVSTVRWGVLDRLHHATGIRQPKLDFSHLATSVSAYEYLVEVHYRYYQFYANTAVALAFTYALRRAAAGFWTSSWGWMDFGFLLLEGIFVAGSRDTLNLCG